jgi:hypothetical protein
VVISYISLHFGILNKEKSGNPVCSPIAWHPRLTWVDKKIEFDGSAGFLSIVLSS